MNRVENGALVLVVLVACRRSTIVHILVFGSDVQIAVVMAVVVVVVVVKQVSLCGTWL